MKNPKQLSSFRAGFCQPLLLGAVLASTSLVFLFARYAMAQANSGDSPLLPWIGVWTITDSRSATANTAPTVEIRPTSDRKGLEITRRSPKQPDVSETLIPDGTKRPVSAQNCTGWQMAKWIAEPGLILESSEMTCKETGSLATSTLKMILATDQMAEILSVKAAGQPPRVAVRRLTFERDLAPAPDLPAPWVATSARTAISAPWNLDTIIRLSKTIDTQLLEAALIEKKVRPSLTSQSLRQMQAAKLPKELIDLTVALAYPDQFHIEKNGQVVLRPWLDSSSSVSASSAYAQPPGLTSYYPGAFYNCYSPQGYFGYSGFGGLAPGSCWSYYSPFWWDYPIYLPYTPPTVVRNSGGGSGGGANGGSGYSVPVTTPGGYAQIEPINPRHARPREGIFPSAGTSGTGWQNQSGTYGGSPSYSGGGGYSGGSAGGAPSASPGGYSSGGSGGGGQAVPR